MKENNELITRKELIEYLRISMGTLQAMMKQREIPYYRLKKRIIFRKSEINEWLNEKKIG